MYVTSTEQCRALSLHAAGYSYREIAALTEATAKQIDRRLQGARAALRPVRASANTTRCRAPTLGR